jgi:serine/threonine-protein kinase
VLYELTTGKLPFEGDSPITIALKQVNEQPVPPRQLNPEIPPELEAIIMQALVKDPAQRYHSADEMKNDLKRFIAGDRLPAGGAAPIAVPMGQTQVMPAVDSEAPVRATHRDATTSRRSGWLWGLVIVVALAIAGVGIAWAAGLFEEKTITVPSVVGMSSEEASETIQAAGLIVGEVEREFDDQVPEGRVISQDPEAGSSVAASATIDFVLSRGKELVAVPELVGLTESEAIKAIDDAGLKLETIQREYDDGVPEGEVMRQSPDAGTEVEPDTRVTIVVSGGTQLVEVPSVSDQNSSDARAELEAAGFTVQVEEQFSDSVPSGRVISQSPSGGVSVPAGSTIKLVVSKGQDLVEVPDVFGDPEAEAVAKLEAEDFVVEIEYVNSPDDGVVKEQWPVAFSSQPRGSTVTITVGQTPDP